MCLSGCSRSQSKGRGRGLFSTILTFVTNTSLLALLSFTCRQGPSYMHIQSSTFDSCSMSHGLTALVSCGLQFFSRLYDPSLFDSVMECIVGYAVCVIECASKRVQCARCLREIKLCCRILIEFRNYLTFVKMVVISSVIIPSCVENQNNCDGIRIMFAWKTACIFRPKLSKCARLRKFSQRPKLRRRRKSRLPR